MATGSYSGKRIIVTGCASGIGAALSRTLVAAGARVIGLDRTPAAGLTHFLPVDLSEPVSIDAAVAQLDEPVDALFNCAGLAPTQPSLAIYKVNFLGTRHISEAILPLIAKGGSITSISSAGGLRWRRNRQMLRALLDTPDFASGLAWIEVNGTSLSNAYGFAKEAVTMWTLHRSATMIGQGVRLNCASPGAVSTPMLSEIEGHVPAAAIDATIHPIGRRSAAEEQVPALLFLGSDAASYVNGVDLPVDGGFAATLALQD